MRRREHARHVGSPIADLRRTLTDRFLLRTLEDGSGPVLEVGPGTGRFTSTLLALGRPTVLCDLSAPMLRAARETARRRGRGPRRLTGCVQAAAESLPFSDRSFGAIVMVGMFGFLGHDGARALTAAARLLRPGGRIVVETQSLTQTMGTLFPAAPGGARRILRHPRSHYLERVLTEGYQPYDPAHFANWEYRFWRPAELELASRAAGLCTVDRMAVGAGAGLHADLLRVLHRDPIAWRTLLRTEEIVGRWEEMWGGGAAFLFAAERPR